MNLTSFNRQFGLNVGEKDAVDWAWPQEAGDTMFHIFKQFGIIYFLSDSVVTPVSFGNNRFTIHLTSDRRKGYFPGVVHFALELQFADQILSVS